MYSVKKCFFACYSPVGLMDASPVGLHFGKTSPQAEVFKPGVRDVQSLLLREKLGVEDFLLNV